jgi:hypothetical protein
VKSYGRTTMRRRLLSQFRASAMRPCGSRQTVQPKSLQPKKRSTTLSLVLIGVTACAPFETERCEYVRDAYLEAITCEADWGTQADACEPQIDISNVHIGGDGKATGFAPRVFGPGDLPGKRPKQIKVETGWYSVGSQMARTEVYQRSNNAIPPYKLRTYDYARGLRSLQLCEFIAQSDHLLLHSSSVKT